MRLFLQAVVDYLEAFFKKRAPIEEYEIIPSIGWNAVYRTGEDDFTRRPLVHWQITWIEDEVVAQHGFVFVENRPPFLEMAYGHPNFVGYEREPVTASKDTLSFGNYEEFSEWS